MRPAGIATAVVLVLTLVACASSQDRGGNNLAATLADVHENPQKRVSAEGACERALAGRGGGFPFQSFAAGLLEVSESAATRAFCAGVVEAVISGDLSQEDLRAFQRPGEIRGRAPLGTLLRAVVGANERLQAQHAQKQPQALACGCGQ